MMAWRCLGSCQVSRRKSIWLSQLRVQHSAWHVRRRIGSSSMEYNESQAKVLMRLRRNADSHTGGATSCQLTRRASSPLMISRSLQTHRDSSRT